MKIERKVTVSFVETDKPANMSMVAQMIAKKIMEEGLTNERERKVPRVAKGNRTGA